MSHSEQPQHLVKAGARCAVDPQVYGLVARDDDEVRRPKGLQQAQDVGVRARRLYELHHAEGHCVCVENRQPHHSGPVFYDRCEY